jgi:hypothetical protein
MKRLITVGLFVDAVLLAGILGILSKKDVAVAVGGGGMPKGNGDVNGDGEIDISDAVYLLTSLFLGGDAPVAIECPPPAGKGLPATGQTKCYSSFNFGGAAEVQCDQASCKGQDGAYTTGCPSEGRFVDNGDGTVTDTCTGLMWQKDTADVTGDGKRNADDAVPWCQALAYCENLSFAGHDDWRLPNVRELQSIVDYGRFNPATNPVFGAFSDACWSSTTFAKFPLGAWYVRFDDGNVGDDGAVFGKGFDFYVRAVRSGP